MNLSSEIKERIADNCSHYKMRGIYPNSTLSIGTYSCDNCRNYVLGHCIKDIQEDVYEKIRLK